jgi:ComF family protein
LCISCLKNTRKALDTPAIYIISIYSFKDLIIKKSIHAIKYFHRKDLIDPLTQELANELGNITTSEQIRTKNDRGAKSDEEIRSQQAKDLTKNWVLVPIPMPRLRKYIRGYNQAELIANSLSKKCSIKVRNDLLIRLKSPKRQVKTKTRSERLLNQHNSFKVIDNVKGMNIILVDDVTTTGATISEARNTLLKAGASNVKAVTIAH